MSAAIQSLLEAAEGAQSTNKAQIFGGKEGLFYGVKDEDRALWGELIDFGDDQAIQNVIKARKSYLLTQVIGNPEDPVNKLLRNNEAPYGNTMLHNRMVNAHDQSVIKLRNPDDQRIQLLQSHCKGADYLLRYYELKQENANKETGEKASKKRAEVSKAISVRDAHGKTPLVLACKNLNQGYALRLINLDREFATLNISDKIENRTPLHIACILGLKDVVKKLLELGANRGSTDIYGYSPFYYLTCSEKEKSKNIQEVLDSVNFFYGRYFDNSEKENITTTLLTFNNNLKEELARENILTQTSKSQDEIPGSTNNSNSIPKTDSTDNKPDNNNSGEMTYSFSEIKKISSDLSKRNIEDLNSLVSLLKKCKLKKDTDLPTPEIALIRASAAGRIDILKALTRMVKDIDINQPGPESGKTALDFANTKEVIEFLTALGAKQSTDKNKLDGLNISQQ